MRWCIRGLDMIALRRSMFEGGCHQEGARLVGDHNEYFLLATSIKPAPSASKEMNMSARQ